MKILPDESVHPKPTSQHSAILADQWFHIFFNLCWLCKYFQFEFVSVLTTHGLECRTIVNAGVCLLIDAGNWMIYLLICTHYKFRVMSNKLGIRCKIMQWVYMLMKQLLSNTTCPSFIRKRVKDQQTNSRFLLPVASIENGNCSITNSRSFLSFFLSVVLIYSKRSCEWILFVEKFVTSFFLSSTELENPKDKQTRVFVDAINYWKT